MIIIMAKVAIVIGGSLLAAAAENAAENNPNAALAVMVFAMLLQGTGSAL